MSLRQDFLLRMPESLDLAAVTPILCAGVTTYSPLKRNRIQAGDKVGIAGIGGLGHTAVMIAKAMGATLTAITTREEKRETALALGADKILIAEDTAMMKASEISLDFILVIILQPFDVNPYICLLKPHGKLVTVGLPGPYKAPLNNMEAANWTGV